MASCPDRLTARIQPEPRPTSDHTQGGRTGLLALLAAAGESEQVPAGRPQQRQLDALRASGLPGAVIPRAYGGLGEDALFANQAVAEVARVDPSLAIVLFQHLAVSARIAEWGSPEQRAALLPRLADGTWLAASAWSEAGAGANKKNLSTQADRRPDGSWQLTGTKAFTTGAGLADLYLVLAVTDSGADDPDSAYGTAGQTLFLLPADTAGLTPDLGLDLEGMRTSATGGVRLSGCRVTVEQVLGAEGAAARIIATVRESGVTLGAVSLGIAQAAYDIAFEHLRRRGCLGQPVTRHLLVDLRLRVEAIRGLVEHAGRRLAENPGNATLYSKLFASVEAERVCDDAQRMLGSAGFLRAHPINSLARDARAVALMGPTNDLCRELVSASWAA